MTVSARYTLVAVLALALPGAAAADTQCCKSGGAPLGVPGVSQGGGVYVAPAPTISSGVFTGAAPHSANPANVPGAGCAGCGGQSSGGTGGIIGGGMSVHVSGPVIAGPTIVAPVVNVPAPTVIVSQGGPSAPQHLQVNTFNSSGGGGFVVFGGGGGGFGGGGFNEAPSAPFALTANSSAQPEPRTSTQLAALQAFCIDDRGTPHPASQTFGEKAVDKAFSGEIYRCMAGTKMRVQIGEFENNEAKFQGASTLECAKNEALRFDGERIACRTQETKRPCNERSLLRRFGPGLKVITLRTTEMIEAPRQSVAMTSAPVVGMHFDGGVGAGGW